jgi:hypothetical protein
MSPTSLTNIFLDIAQKVCVIREELQEELPDHIFVALIKDGEKVAVQLVPMAVDGPEERAIVMARLRDIYCADAVGVVCEAWLTRFDLLKPEQEPLGREEVLLATLFETDHEPRAWNAVITDGHVGELQLIEGELHGRTRQVYESTTTIPEA